MKDGGIVAAGGPTTVITAELVREVFGLECLVITDPIAGTPLIVPAARPPTTRSAPNRTRELLSPSLTETETVACSLP
jgi:iron complex transport system ATP-binding protein